MHPIFKQTHVRAAIFVAPFLIVAGYVITDYFSQKDDNKMLANNKTFELEINKNCQIKKGQCHLKYKNLTMSFSYDESLHQFYINSNTKLTGALMSVNINPLKESVFAFNSNNKIQWTLKLDQSNKKVFNEIHLVVEQKNTLYYAELVF
ncbi:MAG: hypothetical protein DRQ51_07775 [Gammaproteobacteria bacterium]|nr:MAG: hypothetical protein DRQ51_07775 [Gammaproteobacteria bacterium]